MGEGKGVSLDPGHMVGLPDSAVISTFRWVEFLFYFEAPPSAGDLEIQPSIHAPGHSS